MAKRSYRNRVLTTNLSISTDEDAPLWRKEMAEKESSIRWERSEVQTKTVHIRIWGWLDNSPRYLISNTIGNNARNGKHVETVELTYWPLRALDGWEKLGTFHTIEHAKKHAEQDHKTRKIR